MFSWNLEVIFILPNEMASKNEQTTEDSVESGTDEFGDQKVDRLSKPPQNIYGDSQCPDNDVYAQEFFLHGYSIFSIARKRFLESKEGKTYMRLDDHDRLAKRLISQIRGPSGNIDKWNYKVAQMVKEIEVSGANVQFADVDEILYGLMNEFKNQKGAFQTSLEKEFMSVMDTFSVAAPVTYEKFHTIIRNI